MNLYLFKFKSWLLHYKATSINIILPLNTVKSKMTEGIKVKFGCDYSKVYTFLHTKNMVYNINYNLDCGEYVLSLCCTL